MKSIPRTKELDNMELVLLNLILSALHDIDSCKQNIIKAVAEGDFKKAKENSDKMYLLQYDQNITRLKHAFWDNARPEVLMKIAKEDKFISESSFFDKDFIIPKTVLKSFSSYDKIHANTSKAKVAKELGATITM